MAEEVNSTAGSAAFENLVATLDYPIFIVTTAHAGERAGCLVGFTSQTSINPPRFLVGISRKNHTFTVARIAAHLGVHVVPRAHYALAELFGTRTGDDTDKFAACTWHPGPEEIPILDDAACWFAGKVINRFDLGDHVGHLLSRSQGTRAANWVI